MAGALEPTRGPPIALTGDVGRVIVDLGHARQGVVGPGRGGEGSGPPGWDRRQAIEAQRRLVPSGGPGSSARTPLRSAALRPDRHLARPRYPRQASLNPGLSKPAEQRGLAWPAETVDTRGQSLPTCSTPMPGENSCSAHDLDIDRGFAAARAANRELVSNLNKTLEPPRGRPRTALTPRATESVWVPDGPGAL